MTKARLANRDESEIVTTNPDEAEAPDRIAVLFIHGVEIRDPRYAQNATKMLRTEYRRACKKNESAPQLEVEAAYWIPVVADSLDKVAQRAFGDRFTDWTRHLDRLVHRIDNGSFLAMLPLLVSGLLWRLPRLPKVHWPTLRWAFTYFVGDLVAYQDAEDTDGNYHAIHGCIDDALAKLAERAPGAPLCVIAHSLGTVIASDHFYDLQHAEPDFPTALQRGETLTFLYTLGSPIALWMVRYPSFDKPIGLPGRDHGSPETRGAAEWVNFYDPDDIVAYPLKALNEQYRRAVDRDQVVRVGAPILARTPVSHVAYLNSPRIIRPIAERLACLVTKIPRL
jgi:hypothetical protein